MKPSHAAAGFATTHWTAVRAAGEADSPQAAAALEELCRTYWVPLYVFVRRRGYSVEEAQDLTQEFFARLLERKAVAAADQARGKFRWFLLASLRHFLANQWDRATSKKRGGGALTVSLDELTPEECYRCQAADNLSGELMYDRAWALAVLARVRSRLRKEFSRNGGEARFELIEQFLPGQESRSNYAEVGRQLGIAEGSVKSEVCRTKKRFRELLRAEIAATVAEPSEIDEELRALAAALSG